MKHLRIAGLALLALTITAAGARAVELTATTASIIPTHFHWSVEPTGGYRSYHFDMTHGRWNATLTRNDVTVSESGVLPNHDREAFYHGLASHAVWDLNTTAKPAPAGPHYYFMVTRALDQHAAYFDGTPTPDYDSLVTYVNGTFVGQEEKTLESRLNGLPAIPPPKK